MTSIADTNPFIEHPANHNTDASGWEQWEFTFPNGYGASVVKGRHTYGGPTGLWEIAVLHAGNICYDTPVTSDVLGWLDDAAVRETLREIAELPAAVSA